MSIVLAPAKSVAHFQRTLGWALAHGFRVDMMINLAIFADLDAVSNSANSPRY
jgi:hypothetical protein